LLALIACSLRCGDSVCYVRDFSRVSEAVCVAFYVTGRKIWHCNGCNS